MILLATFASLRWGEVAALRRMDLDLNTGTVSIQQQHVELDTGELLIGPPKSRAGVRTVAIPSAIIPALRDHLDGFTDPEDDAQIFTGARAGTLRRSNFRRAADWTKNTKKVGFPSLRFHDLRHTGNTIAASSGATLRDLMEEDGTRLRPRRDDLPTPHGGGRPQDRERHERQDHRSPAKPRERSMSKITCIG